jgi:hypothetical protein
MTKANLLSALVALVLGVNGVTGCASKSSSGFGDAGAPPPVDARADAKRDATSDAKSDATADAETGGPVSLTALDVSVSPTSTEAPVTLTPAFSPGIHDYYVRCIDGANALDVTMTPSPGAQAFVSAPVVTTSLPGQPVALSVTAGVAIVVGARAGTVSSTYWVRCLPPDFPPVQVVKLTATAPPPGYYLVGNTTAPPGEAAYAMVLDVNGVPVWYDRAGTSVFDVESLQTGAVSFNNIHSPKSFEVHELHPLLTTYVQVQGKPADEHELRALPNGDYLTLDAPPAEGFNLTGLVLPTGLDGGVVALGRNTTILDCVVREVNPAGDIVWQWVATDHFDIVKDMTFLYPIAVTSSPPIIEPFHCNSIDVDSLGNLLVSARHMDSIFYIERATGKVLWKMGGSTYSTDGATYVHMADPFYREHDARFQSDWKPTCGGRSGSGGISVFDDETAKIGPARGVVYEVHIGSSDCDAGAGAVDASMGDASAVDASDADAVAMDAGDAGAVEASAGDAGAGASSATIRWQYKGASTVDAMGSCRMQPNGGAIIGWGTTPRFLFTEISGDGTPLLDGYFNNGGASYRAVKVPLEALDLDVMRQTAGQDGTLLSSGAPDSGAPDSGGPDAN